MRISLRAALAAALVLLPAASASAQAVPGNPADAVMSSNVEYLGSLKADVGLTTGARIVGDRLFVTSGKNISIYDIKDPKNPQLLGFLPNAVWENEEVPTNGELLVFASDFYSFHPGNCARGPLNGCVQVFDVRDPANPKQLYTLNEANHTAECALDCQYLYGSDGDIIDLRGALTGTKPTVIGNWIEALKPDVNSSSCHHIREIRPGVLLTACQPFAVISINEEDGGSPESPVMLAKGRSEKFVHSARWPRQGQDKFLMTGGEENFTGRCELNSSEFRTYSAEAVLAGEEDAEFEKVDSVVPAGNGTYSDGKPVAGVLGCSVHWFEEHQSFKDGGLVALSEYENGVRFLQITPEGQIEDKGYFLAAGSASSAPKWVPGTEILYSVDYYRGVDILRWKGEHYVPTAKGKVKREKGRTRASRTVRADFLRDQATLMRPDQVAQLSQLKASGWFAGYCRLIAQGKA